MNTDQIATDAYHALVNAISEYGADDPRTITKLDALNAAQRDAIAAGSDFYDANVTIVDGKPYAPSRVTNTAQIMANAAAANARLANKH